MESSPYGRILKEKNPRLRTDDPRGVAKKKTLVVPIFGVGRAKTQSVVAFGGPGYGVDWKANELDLERGIIHVKRSI